MLMSQSTNSKLHVIINDISYQANLILHLHYYYRTTLFSMPDLTTILKEFVME